MLRERKQIVSFLMIMLLVVSAIQPGVLLDAESVVDLEVEKNKNKTNAGSKTEGLEAEKQKMSKNTDIEKENKLEDDGDKDTLKIDEPEKGIGVDEDTSKEKNKNESSAQEESPEQDNTESSIKQKGENELSGENLDKPLVKKTPEKPSKKMGTEDGDSSKQRLSNASDNITTKSKQENDSRNTLNSDSPRVTFKLSGENKPEKLPVENYMAEVTLNISGDGQVYENPYIKIKMNHDLIEKITSKPEMADSVEFIEDSTGSYAIFRFNELRGGSNFKFEVPIKVRAGLVPEGFETIINATLFDKNGQEIIAAEDNVSFVTKYEQPEFEKLVNGSSANGQTVYKEGIVTYTFNANVGARSYNQRHRSYESFIITDELPEGAEFDADLNPGWTYDANNRTVTYTKEKGSNPQTPTAWFVSEIDKISLHLTYPTANNKDEVVNKATLQLQQYKKDRFDHKEPDHNIEGTIQHTLVDYASGNSYKKAGSDYAFGTREYERLRQIKDTKGDKDKLHTWYFGYNNVYPDQITNFIIEDYKDEDGNIALDERLRFVSINLKTEYNKNNVEKVLKYVDNNGSTELVGSTDGIYHLGDNALGFKVELKEVDSLERINFSVDTEMVDWENVHYDSDNTDNNELKNTVSYSGNYGDNKGFSQDNTQYFVLIDHQEEIRLQKETTPIAASPYSNGDYIVYSLEINYRNLDTAEIYKNLQIVDLLPPGLDPVEQDDINFDPNNSTAALREYAGGNSPEPLYKYEVVENYKGTGRVAYVFNFGDITLNELKNAFRQRRNGASIVPHSWIEIPVQFKVNRKANIPHNRDNEMYVFYDGSQKPIHENSKLKDKYDFNNNGNFEEEILGYTNRFEYVSEERIEIIKYINDNKNQVWGTHRYLPIGTDFNNRLYLLNNQREPLDNLIIYDKLPHAGDKYIETNRDGKYDDRGSEFSNYLTGPAKIDHAGFTIYYLTEIPDEDSTVAVNSDKWKTESELNGEYSQVKAIKAVLNDGEEVKAGGEVNIELPLQAEGFEP